MAFSTNFYMRKSDVKQVQIDDMKKPEFHIRDKCYVRLNAIGDDGESDGTLPTSYAKKVDKLYQPNSSKRPQPTLGDVSVSMSGLAGSLRRLKASFTVYDLTQFNTYEKKFLTPGCKVECKWGYVDGSQRTNKNDKQKAQFVVFKPTYKITKENYFKCSFEAVGQGSEYDQIDINGQQNIPAEEFQTSHQGGEETAKVANLFDYCQFLIMSNLSQGDSAGFNPINGASKKSVTTSEQSAVGALIAPEEFTPPGSMPTQNELGAPRITYISLATVVDIINDYVINDNKKGYKIKFDNDYSAIKYDMAGKKIWSPNPHNLLFPYKNGTPENSYNKDGTTGASEDYITVDSFESMVALEDIAPETGYGTPGSILLSMNFLRELQESYESATKGEDANTEDIGDGRSNGRITLQSFFKKIFAVIREYSGGAWDLGLDRDVVKDEDDKSKDPMTGPNSDIYIVNRNAAMGSVPDAVKLNPTNGKNGIREIAISCDIPKELQSRAMMGDVRSPEGEAAQTFVDLDPPDAKIEAENEAAAELESRHKELRGRLMTDKMSADAVSAAKGLIRDIVNAVPVDDRIKSGMNMDPKNVPFPLKFSATMDGIPDWKFGDVVTSTYLPKRYRSSKATKTVFTVTNYTHDFKGGDWTTSIEAIMRLVSSGGGGG